MLSFPERKLNMYPFREDLLVMKKAEPEARREPDGLEKRAGNKTLALLSAPPVFQAMPEPHASTPCPPRVRDVSPR
jgi:hypothetical protein